MINTEDLLIIEQKTVEKLLLKVCILSENSVCRFIYPPKTRNILIDVVELMYCAFIELINVYVMMMTRGNDRST